MDSEKLRHLLALKVDFPFVNIVRLARFDRLRAFVTFPLVTACPFLPCVFTYGSHLTVTSPNIRTKSP
jgi:hypothetical protein